MSGDYDRWPYNISISLLSLRQAEQRTEKNRRACETTAIPHLGLMLNVKFSGFTPSSVPRACAFTALGLISVAVSLNAQVSINSSTQVYSQNFDSLPRNNATSWSSNSTLPGWYASNGTIDPAYRNGTTTLNSFGSFTVPSDRALGGSVSGAGGQDTTRFGLRLINNTGQTLYSAEVAYFGEKWWASGINNGFHYSGGLVMEYAVNGTGISAGSYLAVPSLGFDPAFGIVPDSPGNGFYSNFVDSWSLNGNHTDYRAALSGTIEFVNGWGNGQELWLRWTLSSFGQANSLSDGLAIDDFSIGNFNTTPIPEPGSFALLTGCAAMLLVVRRRRRTD